jgi:hypothetical protein
MLKVKVFDLPDAEIFGRRIVTEIKLPGGCDFQIVKRLKAANWIPSGLEFGIGYFGPKGGCKWSLQLTKEEISTIWEEMGLAMGRLRGQLVVAGWTEHPAFPRGDWKEEVAADNTQLGYWDWVSHKREEKINEIP